jgi:hypothetical protein
VDVHREVRQADRRFEAGTRSFEQPPGRPLVTLLSVAGFRREEDDQPLQVALLVSREAAPHALPAFMGV